MKKHIDYKIVILILSVFFAVLAISACSMRTCDHRTTETIEGYASTCTSAGLTDGEKCATCKEILVEQVKIKKLTHDYITDSLVPASCTSVGEHVKKCKLCGNEETEILEILPHKLGFVKTETEPTCLTDGLDKYACEACNYVEEKMVIALGHDTSKHEISQPNCVDDGLTEVTCSRCDYLENEISLKLGHDYVDYSGREATCTEKGWDEYQTCSRCDFTSFKENKPLGHDYVSHFGKAATCTEIGWESYKTCTRCDYNSYVEIPELGHYISDQIIKAATCTKVGYVYGACSRCDYTSYVEFPELGHNNRSYSGKAATCTEVGWNAYEECTRCDYTSYVEILAKGHNYDAWTAIVKGNDVVRSRTCDSCDDKEIEPLKNIAYDTFKTPVIDGEVWGSSQSLFDKDYEMNNTKAFTGKGTTGIVVTTEAKEATYVDMIAMTGYGTSIYNVVVTYEDGTTKDLGLGSFGSGDGATKMFNVGAKITKIVITMDSCSVGSDYWIELSILVLE